MYNNSKIHLDPTRCTIQSDSNTGNRDYWDTVTLKKMRENERIQAKEKIWDCYIFISVSQPPPTPF
jgi:hypothetical protein